MTNQDRVALIEKVLADLFEMDDLDRDTALTDLLADARHFCDEHGFDYAAIDKLAYMHYLEEREHRYVCEYCGNFDEFEDHEGLGHQKRCLMCGRLVS